MFMVTGIEPNEAAPEVFIKKYAAKQIRVISETALNSEARTTELRTEEKKQKPITEERAKFMQEIWGDKFQSDYLY
jgi:hypothetical protein